jgi:predicted RNA-binding protein with PUA-like domain
MNYWLMKSEPEDFSVTDLAKIKRSAWTGVRNYQARNHMRSMKVGDRVLFYHSSAEPPGVAGLAEVTKTGVVDETQFDKKSEYYDASSTKQAPRWDCVEIAHVETFPTLVPLEAMRAEPALKSMLLLKRGMRLSVQPVTAGEFKTVVSMAKKEGKKRPDQ